MRALRNWLGMGYLLLLEFGPLLMGSDHEAFERVGVDHVDAGKPGTTEDERQICNLSHDRTRRIPG